MRDFTIPIKFTAFCTTYCSESVIFSAFKKPFSLSYGSPQTDCSDQEDTCHILLLSFASASDTEDPCISVVKSVLIPRTITVDFEYDKSCAYSDLIMGQQCHSLSWQCFMSHTASGKAILQIQTLLYVPLFTSYCTVRILILLQGQNDHERWMFSIISGLQCNHNSPTKKHS